jgi:outer membrane protein, heavy metal efflux system
MKNKIFITVVMLVSFASLRAQSNMETTLAAISKNNKTILANAAAGDAQKLQFTTGLRLSNPVVEFDYLKGSPSNAGNQTDFTVSQQFDFPTSYAKKRQLVNQQSSQVVLQLQVKRQDIMLEAKKACIRLVYHNKMQSQLAQRKKDAEKLSGNYLARLDKGDANILDVNKAKLQLIEITNNFQKNISAINQLNQKLTELNGGEPIVFADTIYSEVPAIPDFETLEKEYEDNDPLRKALDQEKVIAEKQLAVSKVMALPKMEFGYHYQGILGQTYQGVHTGISIPLWEYNNVIKQNRSQITASAMEIDAHVNEHYYHIRHLYEHYSNLKITMDAYHGANFDSAARNKTLINKAFALGQISSLEYFMEMTYYYTALDNYLETEMQYHDTIAELFKFKLKP